MLTVMLMCICLLIYTTDAPIDDDMFLSHPYQRVYQYMHRHIAKKDLDQFSFQSCSVLGNKEDRLEIMLR